MSIMNCSNCERPIDTDFQGMQETHNGSWCDDCFANEPPLGAIENGREHFRRLVDFYDFECEGGSLEKCSDFQDALRCFEVLAAWVSEHAASKP